MARKEKKLIDENWIDKRADWYYSTPDFIAKYISDRLVELKCDWQTCLDPAVWKEELLDSLYEKWIVIDWFDINNYWEYEKCNFSQKNFIDFYLEQKWYSHWLHYDYYIANPPYNCHEIDYIRENKNRLKKAFGTVWTHNVYSMFMFAIIDLAKDWAIIWLIVSDSFLNAKAHLGLRRKIIEGCIIHDIILCPTNLFRDQDADVRTSIIILQKWKWTQNKINTINRYEDIEKFKDDLKNKNTEKKEINEVILWNIKKEFQFIIWVDYDIVSLFSKYNKLWNIFNCITWISTGNDWKFLSKNKSESYEIPFYKNPWKNKFICKPDTFIISDFLNISKWIKDFMVRNKQFLFKEWITCSSMGLPFSACYLPKWSAFWVNANIFCEDKEDIFRLLSYLNSSLVTYLVRGVLIRTNMITSWYVSNIPIIDLSEYEKKRLWNIAKNIINGNDSQDLAIEEIDDILFKNLQFSKEVYETIIYFSKNLKSLV